MNIQEIAHEFRTFVLKGNVVDLAVGIVIGAAFKSVIDSFVKDLITPLVGVFGGEPDFGKVHLGPLAIGSFINAILAFLILATVVFFFVVKPMNYLIAMANRKAEEQPAEAPLPEDVKLLMEIRDLLKTPPSR
ncbi:MAG TPA: large conductance mechanosensitive channel protein MscL [Chthoniobacteraceae bacterium]|nr:large conductance mechanosensitive channel protein MscL [Chthoniobacteraceae bacterium]